VDNVTIEKIRKKAKIEVDDVRIKNNKNNIIKVGRNTKKLIADVGL